MNVEIFFIIQHPLEQFTFKFDSFNTEKESYYEQNNNTS